MSRVIGLTGGIASGKSTVSAMLKALGAAVVDADVLAREVVAPGSEALELLRRRFGDDVLNSDGSLDRKRLGQLVFADRQARDDLGSITHPRIAALSQKRIAELFSAGADPVIYDAALIVENGLHKAMAGLIVVSIPPALQAERMIARDGMSTAEAQARIDAQVPLEDKLKAATWVVDNSGTLDDTQRQVKTIWLEIHSA